MISIEDQLNINFTNDLLMALKEIWESVDNEEMKKDIFSYLMIGLTYFKQKYPTKYGEIVQEKEE